MNLQEFIAKNKTPVALMVGAVIIAGAIYFSGNQPPSPSESFKFPPAQNQNRNEFQLPAELSTEDSEDCLIKGNISSKGERIYHVPGGQFYDRTVISTSKGEKWFCSEKEAQNAGWRRSLR